MFVRYVVGLGWWLIALTAQAQSVQFEAPAAQDDTVHFAVVADLTGGERAGVFEVAANGLAMLQPDFIMSVGDLIEGGTEDIGQLNAEWDSFLERINLTQTPFYPLVGNHDISNMVQSQWWEETVGPRYYHFRHGDLLFLMLDSEDFQPEKFEELDRIRAEASAVLRMNPDDFEHTAYAKAHERKYGQLSEAQVNYFQTVLSQNSDAAWTFVFMHKPTWQAADTTGFGQIEANLSGRDYTVFNGHVHGYEHTKRLGMDYIQLATTGGVFVESFPGKPMDHILWVSVDENEPSYLNLRIEGMVNLQGQLPAGEIEPCFIGSDC